MNTAKEIRKLKKQIDDLRPLSKGELAELKKWYDVTYTFHSNALEGNTLTLAETKIVVEDGITVGGHPVREILEAKNHKIVIDNLVAAVQKKQDLNEELLLFLHKNLIKGIDDESAGKYRKLQVYMTGDEKMPPKAKEVLGLIEAFFGWYNENKEKMDAVELAARAHYKLVKIHPFIDGNGRISRIIANLILMQAGYPLVIIPMVLRQKYIESLHSKTGSEEIFLKFFQETTLENMKDYLRMIEEDEKS